MKNIKKPSFSTIKKFDKNNNKFKLLKYKTDRNSQEKANLIYSKKAKFKKKHKIIYSFGNKINSIEDITIHKINYNPMNSYDDTIRNAYSKLNNNLRKYNFSKRMFNIQKTNEIIFDKNKRLVCIFKDYLFWNETSDFLKQYYIGTESIKLLPNMCEYYEEFTLLYPEYGPLEDVLKIMKRYIKKKKLIIEKFEDNDEHSILNRNYEGDNNNDDDSKRTKNKKKDKIKKNEFKKIINEKDMNLDMSKTYSHSKTCFYWKNENGYIIEKEKGNSKTLSSIIAEFLINDEKIIENYNYIYNKKINFKDDSDEKKIENYFYMNNIYKDKKNKYKKNIKNKGYNDIEMQKFKLKNIVKMIESTNNYKKINKKYLSENITNKKGIKTKEEKSKSKNMNKKVTSKNSPAYKKIMNTNKINPKLININLNSTSNKKKIIKPITLKFDSLSHKINNKKIKYNNNSSSENLNKLFLSKSKVSNSKSNNASKNKTTHRYKVLINKIFKNIPKNQKLSLNKYTQARNHSDGQKYLIKKNMNLKMKSKEKPKIENNYIKKIISNNKIYNNNYLYSNINNFPSFSSINKTSSEKTTSLNNKKNNIKKNINIKIKISRKNYNINNYKNNINPFILNNNSMLYKNSYNEKNKTINLNDYLLLSLSNRINSTGKNKTKLNLKANKTIKKEYSNYFNKSLNSIEFTKIKNQSCIRPVNNYNRAAIIKNTNSKEKKYQLNTYNKNHLKMYTDSSISRNDKNYKEHKENNSIKLKGIITKDKNNIKNLKNYNNKKEGITSRENNKSNTIKINSKRFINGRIICNLKKNEFDNGKVYKKINFNFGKIKKRDNNINTNSIKF